MEDGGFTARVVYLCGRGGIDFGRIGIVVVDDEGSLGVGVDDSRAVRDERTSWVVWEGSMIVEMDDIGVVIVSLYQLLCEYVLLV